MSAHPLDPDLCKAVSRAEAAEARVAELEAAARGGNAINDNAEAFKHAANELERLGSTEKDFIRALRERASIISAALQRDRRPG